MLMISALTTRAVCTVFSMWLSEYPEDFKSLGEPSRLLRLAPLLPQDSSSAADLRARLLRVAEELSERALLHAAHRGHKQQRNKIKSFFYDDITSSCLFFFAVDLSAFSSPPPDASRFEPKTILGFLAPLVAEQLTKIETVSLIIHN